MKRVYEQLRVSPQWANLALIICCDESGGTYDHVVPPSVLEGIPHPDDRESVDSAPVYTFNSLGVRVPLLIISPWVKRGKTLRPDSSKKHVPYFDHSSLCATLLEQFRLTSYLTHRDKWAPSFTSVFSHSATFRSDCPLSLPNHYSFCEEEEEYAIDDTIINLRKQLLRKK